MTPDPKALAVMLDAARACYGDDSEQVRWLLNQGAVRELLKHDPLVLDDNNVGEEWCAQCEAERFVEGHFRTCPIAAAWRALGDPRGAADIERAHEEALDYDRVRGRPIDREALRARMEIAALLPPTY